MPRAAPTGRGVGASRSFDPSTMGRGPPQRRPSGDLSMMRGPPQRRPSGDLGMMQQRGGGRPPPPRTRSGDLSMMQSRPPPPNRGVGRGRSMSPGRMQDMARGRSNSPSRGRAPPDRRGVAPSRSFDASMMGPGGGRGRPAPSSRGVAPTRSFDGGRGPPPRSRSMSPGRMAAMQNQQRARSRSRSPGGMDRARSRSRSPGTLDRGRSSRPGLQKIGQSFRRGLGRRSSGAAYNDPNRRGNRRGSAISKMGKSMRAMTPKDQCDMKKICCYLVPVVIMIGSVGGLVTATGNAGKVIPDGIQDRIADFIPSFDNSKLDDPFAEGTDIPKWKTEGAGLYVKIQNACEDTWDVEFSLAVSDWDFGNPDALDLSDTEKVSWDNVCEDFVEGIIKVCSSDFGETPWRGLNQLTTGEGGWVIASLAQMNDYYLANEIDAARRYTMCHELGHAFGLPHTDEEFGNPDLGNCLDYTDNFEFNQSPDASNYASLIELYGPIGLGGPAGTTDGGRQLQQGPGNLRGGQGIGRRTNKKTMPDDIRHRRDTAVKELKAQEIHPERHSRIAAAGWKLLHHSPHGEEHEMDLGEGFKVRVHMLLAHPHEHDENHGGPRI